MYAHDYPAGFGPNLKPVHETINGDLISVNPIWQIEQC